MFLYTEANGLSAKALPQNVDTGVTIVTKETWTSTTPNKRAAL